MKKPIQLYVAGGWIHRASLKGVMQSLRNSGFGVTSGWIERENGDYSPKALAEDAKADFEEIRDADVLVAIMDDPTYAYRGSFTEIGYALGLGRHVIIVCPLERRESEGNWTYSHTCATNVFFWHPNIVQADTIADVPSCIRQLFWYKCDFP